VPELPDDVTATWAAALADPCGHAGSPNAT
jgi:hypothetical protein